MTFILSAAGILFAFGLVIFVHEFGHFIVAKKSGVKVERFSFGLGPEMIGFKMGETRYCIAWLPLGGEVRMAGEMVDGEEKKEPEPIDPNEDTSRHFFSKPWHVRVAIALAGPTMNYVLAIVIFFGMLMYWGEPTQINRTEVGGVVADMPAIKAGIQKGDKILSVQGQPVEDFPVLAEKIHDRAGLETQITLLRNNQQMVISVTPQKEDGKIGIRAADPITENHKLSVLEAGKGSVHMCWYISATTVYYLYKKISEREKPDMAGPLGISQVIAGAVKKGPQDFFYLIAMISVAIGLFNLFPIPLLDGGHVMYHTIEGIRGKPVSMKVMARANMVGLAFLLSLLVFATFNDVQRLRGSKEKPAAETPAEKPAAPAETPAK